MVFVSQTCFDKTVACFFPLSLKDALWLLYLFLKFSVQPMYVFVVLSAFVVALYMTGPDWQLFATTQSLLTLQLHGFFACMVACFALSLRTLLLCDWMMLLTFFVQLYEILMQFLLMTLRSGCCAGK